MFKLLSSTAKPTNELTQGIKSAECEDSGKQGYIV